MTVAVIVPVKDLGQAKSRLSPLLSVRERQALAELLLAGVLDAVDRLPAAVRKLVVTSYAPAIAMAEARGMECLRETRQVSESQSVDQASAHLESEGVAAVLRLPLDLPLIESGDLEAILREGEAGRQAVLVPSLDGTGTNALLRSPPTLFPSRFGPDSRALHEQSLKRLGVPYSVLPLPTLALDLDDAADLEELLRQAKPCAALEFLTAIGVPGRLAAIRKGVIRKTVIRKTGP